MIHRPRTKLHLVCVGRYLHSHVLNKFLKVFNMPTHKISVHFSPGPIRFGFSKMNFVMVQVSPGFFKIFGLGPVLNFSNLVCPGPGGFGP